MTSTMLALDTERNEAPAYFVSSALEFAGNWIGCFKFDLVPER